MRTRGRLFSRAAALVAVGVLALTACGGNSGTKGGGGEQGYVEAADTGVTRIAAGDRKPAPKISGEDLTGKPIGLADYAGKVVVLNVWGSWCNPCRGEAPNLQKVFADTQAQGVQFLGINTRDSGQDNAIAFEKRFGITYPSMWDPEGRQILQFKGDIVPNSIPTTLVIDRQGRIAARAPGGVSESKMRAMLDPVLAEQA